MAQITAEQAQLKVIAKLHEEKLRKIKVCAFDIDGVLSDGTLTYLGEELGYVRSANVLDGFGMKILMKAGIKVGVISGGDAPGLRKRYIDLLKLDFVHLGNEDKRDAFLKVKALGPYQDEEILYMGDEFIDLPILARVGFSATVPSASIEIQEVSHYITQRPAGQGCVREVIDILRFAQGITAEIPQF